MRMRSILSASVLCVVFAAVVQPAFAQTAAADDSVDTIFMGDATSSTRTGRITGVDAQQIRLEVPLPGGTGGRMSVSVPRRDVERVEFSENESRDQLLADPDLQDIHEIAVLWRAWQSAVDLPKSPSARIGNIYATLLLQTRDATRAAEALAIFTLLENSAWEESEQRIARQGRLRAMVATGNAADAVAEAEALAVESEDPEVLIEAKFILAEAARSALAELQEENPRWEEDINVRPDRARLYHEALDLYLYPYLFFGSETETASRGLWGVVTIHQLNDDVPAAIEASRDLVRIYPETSFGRRAEEFLATLPEDQLQQDNEKEAQDENQAATETEN